MVFVEKNGKRLLIKVIVKKEKIRTVETNEKCRDCD